MSADNGGLGVVGSAMDRPSQAEPFGTAYQEAYAAGETISGKYRLVRPIGRGGMGVVWQAHSELLDIPVAIKLVQQFSASQELRQRLLLEARAAARLVDPGIIRIFDCGETSKGDPYIVMELLEGEDLASRLEHRGRLPPIEAIRTLLPIVRALGVAHAANIVHRDLKPENVFFTKSQTAEEQPKLFDFGIAKVDVEWDKRLTQAGSTLGSPSYMSPEQAQGNEIDTRSDLWSVAVVLYEAITGQLPFDGTSYQGIVHAILFAEPKSLLELGVDEPELWSIIAKGLERNRELRLQSCDELAVALSAWLIDRGVTHDVTGVSLHASRTNSRVRQFQAAETARPPSESGNQLRASRSAQVNAIEQSSRNGRWMQSSRPLRYVWVMLMLAALGALLSVAVKRVAAKRSPDVSPSAEAAPEPRRAEPLDPMPAALAPSAEPESAAPEATASSTPAAVPLTKRAASKASQVAKPKSKAAAPSGEPFKSPFD